MEIDPLRAIVFIVTRLVQPYCSEGGKDGVMSHDSDSDRRNMVRSGSFFGM